MKNKYLSADNLTQVFLSCGMEDHENGMFADDVDLFEFTDAIIEAVTQSIARDERKECIKFVNSLNTTVGAALQEKRGGM